MNDKWKLRITKFVFKFAFITDFINGWISGFPLCCIFNFCKHSILGRMPAHYCDTLYGKDKLRGYVRCKRCRDVDHYVEVKEGYVRSMHVRLMNRWNLVLTSPRDKSKMKPVMLTENDFWDGKY